MDESDSQAWREGCLATGQLSTLQYFAVAVMLLCSVTLTVRVLLTLHLLTCVCTC